MKLMRVGVPGHERPALLDAGGRIRDLSGIVPDLAGEVLLPEGMQAIRSVDPTTLPLLDPGQRVGPCVGRIGKFFCIGLNYSDHAADEVPDPHALDLWLEVDGHRYQAGNTRHMIFKVPQLVAYLSRFMSLQPGDIISTGTPPGVGMGIKPVPVFLRPGQCMRVGIQGLGEQQQLTIAA